MAKSPALALLAALCACGDPADPTVILSHGFPELAHSWRHQLPALADAGYHVLQFTLFGLVLGLWH